MGLPPVLFDLPGEGSVALTGRDRAAFLQGLVTNDVKALAPGQGCAAAFLTAKGKLLATCVVLSEADRLVLDTPPELAATVESLLRKYLVFNDVTISNETEDTHVLHLAGGTAGVGREEEDFLRRFMGPGAGVAFPVEPHANTAAIFTFEETPLSPGGAEGAAPPRAAGGGATPIVIVRENRTGAPGWDLRCPSSLSAEISSSLLSAGARRGTPDLLEALRIAAGIPRWGADLTDAVLPDEVGMRERGFIAESKGCYVGQEIVARIKTYGHVNRLLVGLRVSGGLPSAGDGVFFEGEKAGILTSVAPALESEASATAVALGFVKRERASAGTALTISPFEGNLPSLPAIVTPAGPASVG